MVPLRTTPAEKFLAAALLSTLASVPLSIVGTLASIRSAFFAQAADASTSSGPIMAFAAPVLWLFWAVGYVFLLRLLWALRARMNTMHPRWKRLVLSLVMGPCLLVGILLVLDCRANLAWHFEVLALCDAVTLAGIVSGVLFATSLA